MKALVTVTEYGMGNPDYRDLCFDKLGNAWDIVATEFVEDGFALLLTIVPANWNLNAFDSLGMTPIGELDLLHIKDLFCTKK